MYVLDSSAIIEMAAATERAKKLANFLKEELLSTTPFSIFEVYFGLSEKKRPKIEALLLRTQILDFDRFAAMESVLIEKKLEEIGKPIGIIDLFIASVCRFHDATLVTFDTDFKHVEGLKAKIFD